MGRMAELAAELEEMDGPSCPEDCMPDPRNDERCLCSHCNGSGEGMYDGSSCRVCHGSGEVRDLEAERDREDERADYLRDQAKDDRLMAQYDDRFDGDLPF